MHICYRKNNNPVKCKSVEKPKEKTEKLLYKIYKAYDGDEKAEEIEEALKHLQQEYREVVRMFYL